MGFHNKEEKENTNVKERTLMTMRSRKYLVARKLRSYLRNLALRNRKPLSEESMDEGGDYETEIAVDDKLETGKKEGLQATMKSHLTSSLLGSCWSWLRLSI